MTARSFHEQRTLRLAKTLGTLPDPFRGSMRWVGDPAFNAELAACCRLI